MLPSSISCRGGLSGRGHPARLPAAPWPSEPGADWGRLGPAAWAGSLGPGLSADLAGARRISFLGSANSWLSYVSPRRRAQRTLELLNLACEDQLPWQAHGAPFCEGQRCLARIEVTEDIREWDYGDYEGITTPHIRELRKEQGLDPSWDIWRDGCPGGE